MPTFEFTAAATTASAPSANIAFTDNGVNFTFSATDSGGQSHFIDQNAFGDILGMSSGTDGGTADVFTLALTGTQLFNGQMAFVVGGTVVGTWTVSVNGQTAQITTAGQTFTVGPAGTYSSITFTSTNSVGSQNILSIDSITADIVCYLEGTMIATPEGEVAVETLKAGDTVLTADGGTTTVRWLGEQAVDTTTRHPASVNPIRISAGALGDGVPHRDLYLSPDHAVEIDGMLVNASALVNGTTITQLRRMPAEGFTYYHVETDAHELIVAEGAAAESYYDIGDRSMFVNAAEAQAAPRPEMALPRITASRMLPQPVKARLAARATTPKIRAA